MEEAGRGSTPFVDIRIPNPEATVPLELRVGRETEETSFVISLWNGITEPGKSGNVASKPSYFSAKVEKDFGRAIRGQALAVELPWLSANKQGISYDVDIRYKIDMFEDWL